MYDDSIRRRTLTMTESWVEIASQPSSSSLSSIGDEIVTTGLRIGNNSYPVRRRRLHQQHQHVPPPYIVSQSAAQAGTSSQDEYDETESEEDRVLTSSTEHVQPSANALGQTGSLAMMADSDSEDDDENATALGRPSNLPNFRPQPNAFSHPPSHLTHRHSSNGSIPQHPSLSRPSMPSRSQTRPSRGPHNFMSPSYRADHEEALRASLTTLLSCAAAARGLPKKDDGLAAGPSTGVGVVPSSQPVELRLVPESELMSETPALHTVGNVGLRPGPERTASNSSAPSAPSSASSRDRAILAAAEKTKRAATTQSKPSRATKKKRTSLSANVDGSNETAALISPTLLTWVVSAGVVVLVSVVGFGAGYVIGREVGRQEACALSSSAQFSAPASNGSSCAGDLVRSAGGGTLRRLRWGSVRSAVA
jgi:hypothetical protein